jgi:hypothetical protein
MDSREKPTPPTTIPQYLCGEDLELFLQDKDKDPRIELAIVSYQFLLAVNNPQSNSEPFSYC